MPNNVYIVMDHLLLRDRLADFLDRFPDLQVCGKARTGQEALAHVPQQEVDVVVVAVYLPDIGGCELIKALRTRLPHVPCVMLATVESGHYYARQALAAGVRGIIVKGKPEEIPAGVRQVLAGKTYFSAPLCKLWLGLSECTMPTLPDRSLVLR